MAKRQGVVEGLPNYGLTMATDIRERWKASLSQRLLESPWGKVDFTALARAHYLRLFIWRTIPAQIWPRDDLEKSINPAGGRLLHLFVCVTQRIAVAPPRWKNGARFPNISSLIKADQRRGCRRKTNTNKTGSVMIAVGSVQTGLRRDFY